MRELEIRRHTDNDDDVLSAAGVTAAVELGRADGGGWQLAVSSGAQRATQTIAAILAGGGHEVPDGVVVDRGFRSDEEDAWRDAYQEAGGGHLDDFRRVAPELVERDSEVLADALRRTLDRLHDGGRALVVGHSPTSEAAVLGLTGQLVEPLGTGEGVLVRQDGDTWTVTRLD